MLSFMFLSIEYEISTSVTTTKLIKNLSVLFEFFDSMQNVEVMGHSSH